jgi:aspartate-semialdehyde dehydrogenase
LPNKKNFLKSVINYDNIIEIPEKEKTMIEKVKVGFIGWRGMVGSVLMQRMENEGDFARCEPFFFSTSQVGESGPIWGGQAPLEDAFSIEALSKLDIILSTQGGEYTARMYASLRSEGWKGYWIDAASSLRLSESSCLVLDPVNCNHIRDHIHRGTLDYIGANCTVSLMLMAFAGLFKANLVEWTSSMTYQAASGAGARHMRELLEQMNFLGEIEKSSASLSESILALDSKVTEGISSSTFPKAHFGAALAGSLIPWIDKEVEDGQTKEEWKAMVESHKILNNETIIPIDGTCVRIGSMRSHAQGLTIKLKEDLPLDEIIDLIERGTDSVEIVPNQKEATLDKLTPAYTSGTLKIPVGRLRKMKMGPTFLNAFTVGDQLLWGAAEPLRRAMNMLIDEINS